MRTGLICLTAAIGPLAMRSASGGMPGRPVDRRLREHFGRENVYAEFQRHLCREKKPATRPRRIARTCTPLVATNGVCHAPAAATCSMSSPVRQHGNASNAGRLLTRNSERHLNVRGDGNLFADLPEAIANTLVFPRACNSR